MSVFDTLKDSILSVRKDISTGINVLTSKDSGSGSTNGKPSPTGSLPSPIHAARKLYKPGDHVNLDAGAELLTKFQDSWSDMHQSSEDNAKKAKAVDSQVGEFFLHFERQKEAVGLFLQEISVLPQLLQDLQAATDNIQSLEQQLEVADSELVKLEDVCEREELHRNMRHHEYQLAAYRQRRSVELEQAKVRMAREHASKVQKYEYHLQRNLREKQQAFEATFKEEIQHYKKYGKTKNFVSPKPSPSKDADLSGFVPDKDAVDDAMLDEFLDITLSDADTFGARINVPDGVSSDLSEHQVVVAATNLSETQVAAPVRQNDPKRDKEPQNDMNIENSGHILTSANSDEAQDNVSSPEALPKGGVESSSEQIESDSRQDKEEMKMFGRRETGADIT